MRDLDTIQGLFFLCLTYKAGGVLIDPIFYAFVTDPRYSHSEDWTTGETGTCLST